MISQGNFRDLSGFLETQRSPRSHQVTHDSSQGRSSPSRSGGVRVKNATLRGTFVAHCVLCVSNKSPKSLERCTKLISAPVGTTHRSRITDHGSQRTTQSHTPSGVSTGGACHRNRSRSIFPLRLNSTPSRSRIERWRPMGVSGSRSVEHPPEAFTTRCHGTSSGQRWSIQPTATGEIRLPMHTEIWP